MSEPSVTASSPLPSAAAACSKRLSWLLRHGAREAGLAMDAEGWAAVDDVQRVLEVSFEELRTIVATNEKQRFELAGDRVRAVQGHSAGAPVALDALEASWRVTTDDARVFHGTSVAAARAILGGEGIVARQRSHVHLAPSPRAKVGKRARVELLLVVDPARLRASGETLFVAPNGVLLTRRVPVVAIVDVLPAEPRFAEEAAALRPPRP